MLLARNNPQPPPTCRAAAVAMFDGSLGMSSRLRCGDMATAAAPSAMSEISVTGDDEVERLAERR